MLMIASCKGIAPAQCRQAAIASIKTSSFKTLPELSDNVKGLIIDLVLLLNFKELVY
jgi:hypothetical protein